MPFGGSVKVLFAREMERHIHLERIVDVDGNFSGGLQRVRLGTASDGRLFVVRPFLEADGRCRVRRWGTWTVYEARFPGRWRGEDRRG